jgi:Stress responsive A/B Barrel Domain
MYKLTRLIHLSSGLDDTRVAPLITRLRETLDGAQGGIVERTLPGSRNGGDLLLHARFTTEKAREGTNARLEEVFSGVHITHVDGVDYHTDRDPTPDSPGSVYRTLLLAVAPHTPEAHVARFESDLLLMPQFVSTITACALNRPSRTLGTSRWTHVFEQEFTDEAGLLGPYLMHPVHWGLVDRWFDPECPEVVVRERICHSYCRCDGPVLATGRRPASEP